MSTHEPDPDKPYWPGGFLGVLFFGGLAALVWWKALYVLDVGEPLEARGGGYVPPLFLWCLSVFLIGVTVKIFWEIARHERRQSNGQTPFGEWLVTALMLLSISSMALGIGLGAYAQDSAIERVEKE